MADQSGLLEKEVAAFADNKKRAQKSRHNTSRALPERAKLPEMDAILENTLNNIRTPIPLTKREAEILQLIVAGNTNKKIAQQLYRAERTIEYHRNQLMRKLGAHNAAGLVKRAIDMGIT